MGFSGWGFGVLGVLGFSGFLGFGGAVLGSIGSRGLGLGFLRGSLVLEGFSEGPFMGI